MMKNNIIIIGSGGHSRVIIDSYTKTNYNIIGIIDINFLENKGTNELILGYPVIGNINSLENFKLNFIDIFLAIGNNELRKKYCDMSIVKQYSMPFLLDKHSTVSNHSEIGLGTFVGPGSIINAGAVVGKNSIINTGSIIEHEVCIGDFTHVGPGTKIAGRVSVGKNVNIGIGVSIKNNITIGENAIIGAGSVVIDNVLPYTKVAGIPAKII